MAYWGGYMGGQTQLAKKEEGQLQTRATGHNSGLCPQRGEISRAGPSPRRPYSWTPPRVSSSLGSFLLEDDVLASNMSLGPPVIRSD